MKSLCQFWQYWRLCDKQMDQTAYWACTASNKENNFLLLHIAHNKNACFLFPIVPRTMESMISPRRTKHVSPQQDSRAASAARPARGRTAAVLKGQLPPGPRREEKATHGSRTARVPSAAPLHKQQRPAGCTAEAVWGTRARFTLPGEI